MKAKFLQCTVCGQVIAGTNPDNLKRVCLACCKRMKDGGDPDVPFISFSAETPLDVLPCPERERTKQDKCNPTNQETETC